MKPWMYVAGGAFALLVGFGAFVWYSLSEIGGTVMETHFRDGSFGKYTIGQTKEEVLTLLSQSYVPDPKPTECPANWINAGNMTETQRGCLLKTDMWHTEDVADRYVACPYKTDEHSTLHFSGGRLVRIHVRCTRAL